ncbi:PREDICTED: dehydrogenase/reductase SDR family member 11-like isoform X4 [Amphimedon queenslandica]|uniref:Dehydrogenase/reductase SDR family member 11 n=1 Tax=Amphimedon queenslandica TaxID=400682 RepID=A0AAN0JGN0_AMPQE|nr:PREDICTED: dehydrogenase/reductase SDR family member 11-like isoform X3 [Amphimedon queenslandica]XP_019855961.1 PREDICTED: dehydrogenase/reductase SDR family member 11-like isoform X4 [Amphimedon queenslandica]|eukprot:XP_019855960.1 PREDICTED: dehydrogenase/reductase SDR family member 11-like isoform X3 [Amphimedon queenslandica]
MSHTLFQVSSDWNHAGTSSGIGAGIAASLLKNGIIILGVPRDVERIKKLSDSLGTTASGGKLVGMKCDVTNEDDIKSVFSYAKDQFGGIDVCVNNAGLSHSSSLLTGDTKEWRNMLDVMILAPCIITREFMNQVKERGVDDAHIIFINSILGHVVPPQSPHFYCATKFAITAIAEGVRQELREMKSNCRCTSISPGVVKTEIFGRAFKAEDIQKAVEDVDKLISNGMPLLPDDIGNTVLFVLSAPPRMEVNEIIVTTTGKLLL